MQSKISTNPKFIIAIIILYIIYIFIVLFSRVLTYWMLKLLTPLFLFYAVIVLYFAFKRWIDNKHNFNLTLSKLFPDDHYKLFEGTTTGLKLMFVELITIGDKRPEKHHPGIDASLLNDTNIFRDMVAIAKILSTLLVLTLFSSAFQSFISDEKTVTNVINKTEPQFTTTTSSSESNVNNVNIVNTTPTEINTPTLISTPTPTSAPLSTPTPTATAIITVAPTRRIIFGQSLSSPERTAVSTPTPTFFLSEREKSGLPSIVLLDVVGSEDNFQPKLLLANFGDTISMASWKLYLDQQLVCTFGEYIFWPDTVLALDLSINLEERTADNQLIIKCKQINEEIFLRPMVIKLQDHLGVEVDRCIYEKKQCS